MSKRLEGKVAVVTGGGSGMGRASVLRFLEEGAKVVILDLNETSGNDTVELARAAGLADVRFLRTNAADEAEVVAGIALARREFGRIDCVFANAAVGGARGLITEIEVEDWDFTLAVVLRSVFLAVKHGARALMEQGGGGSLIVTGSVAGTAVQALPVYGSAKAGVLHFVKHAAFELGPHLIRVNAVSPGAILTPMYGPNYQDLAQVLATHQPLPITGQPEDIANMALFLASDESRFITGANFVVDGGQLAEPPLSAGAQVKRAQASGIVGRDHGTTGQAPIHRVRK